MNQVQKTFAAILWTRTKTEMQKVQNSIFT